MKLTNIFPTFGISNVLNYYLTVIFSNSWLQIGTWMLFVNLFMSTGDFGIIEAVSFLIGLLIEIPSGAFADIFGKKFSINIGYFLLTLGSLLFTLGFINPIFLWIGNIVIMISFAFTSGAHEALLYDSLIEKKLEDKFDLIISRGGALITLILVPAGLLGAWLWEINVYLPWIMTTILFSVAFLISLRFIEPRVDTYKFSWGNFAKQNILGFKYLVNRNLRPFLLPFLLMLGTYFMWDAGIVRVTMADEWGLSGAEISIILAVAYFISFFFNYFYSFLREWFGDFRGYMLLIIIAIIMWGLSAWSNVGVILTTLIFTSLVVVGELSILWASSIVNREIDSTDRATAISTIQFIIQIPYIFIVIFYGNAVETNSESVFYIGIFTLLIISLLWLFSFKVIYLLSRKPNDLN